MLRLHHVVPWCWSKAKQNMEKPFDDSLYIISLYPQLDIVLPKGAVVLCPYCIPGMIFLLFCSEATPSSNRYSCLFQSNGLALKFCMFMLRQHFQAVISPKSVWRLFRHQRMPTNFEEPEQRHWHWMYQKNWVNENLEKKIANPKRNLWSSLPRS